MRRRGVSLGIGIDEADGEIVIRYPDGGIERTGVKVGDDG